MDELFEALTLVQTKKVEGFPIVLVWEILLEWTHRMDAEHPDTEGRNR